MRITTNVGDSTDHLFHRLHVRLLPTFFAVATMCYIDRTNLAFASLQLNRDLQFAPSVYGTGAGLFFAGYSLFMIPSNVILVRVGAVRWLSVLVLTWGLVAASFSSLRTVRGFYCLRFLLGLAESGAFPGMWYYLDQFYPKQQITFAYSIIESAVGVANIVSAPLAAALLSLDGFLGLRGWQWLFLLEAIPSICLGLCIPLLLPQSPSACCFLSLSQKKLLNQQLVPARKAAAEANGLTTWQLVLGALVNGKIWYIGTIGLLKSIAANGIIFWAPILVDAIVSQKPISVFGEGKGKANNDTLSVLLTSVPFTCTSVVAIWMGHHAQGYRDKTFHIAVPYLLSGCLFLIFPWCISVSPMAGLTCLVLITTGVLASNSITAAMAGVLGAGSSAPVALALFNAVSNIGGFLGPWLIGTVISTTGSYFVALRILGAVMGVAGLMALGLSAMVPAHSAKGDYEELGHTEDLEDEGKEEL